MDDQMVIHGFIIPFLLAKTMSKTSFLFSLIFTSLLLFSCRKENYVQLLRSENNRLASSNGKYTTLYSIHTVKGTLLDIYRDANGFINIYKKRLDETDLSLLENLKIKNSKGAICTFATFDMKHLDHIVTSIKGKDPITILQDGVILFKEDKHQTTAGSIYTIRSEITTVEVKQEKSVNNPRCYINGTPSNAKKKHGANVVSTLITISNNKPGFGLNYVGHAGILIKTTDGSYTCTGNDIANNRILTTGLKGTVTSISNNGIYLFNTVEPKSIEKRELKNSFYPCSSNATEEVIYDINTAAYASGPVGSGTFSIYRMFDGKIILYQKNAYGRGSSSVNYEISTANYKISATLKDEPPFLFNEATFSLNESEKIDTKLNGLITVKRNGVVLFDELDEIKKQMTGFCTADFHLASTNSHHNVRRGIGTLFYPMPSNGSPLVLKVKFISGSPNDFREFIMNTVREWEAHAHVRFEFLDDLSTEYAHVRIDVGTGLPNDSMDSYSACGTNALVRPADQATMRLPLSMYRAFRNGHNTEASVSRTVLHEFGHALGLLHEHQNPHREFQWTTAVVYLAFSLRGISKESVDNQFIRVFSGPTFANSGQYDPYSIMNYALPRAFMFGSSACPPTRDDSILNLSDGDKAFIARIYPKPVSSTEFNSRGSGSGREEKPPHRKKPEYTDTTNEPPSFK